MRYGINIIQQSLARNSKQWGKIINIFKRKKKDACKHNSILASARILPRDCHNISRQSLSTNALNVLYHLEKANFDALLVGGSVRDLLLGREPKDFDIATNAHPDNIKKLFRNCRLIGKRFRLAHIYFKNEIIEVATFRASSESENSQTRSDHGQLLRDNVYGTLQDDVWRRDFTVNALYYNIADFSVIDFVNGMDDIKNGIIRIIGNAHERYREDPVRMLRAIRFAAKLGFKIEPSTEAPFNELRHLLAHISHARLFDESLKLLLFGYARETFSLLQQYHLLGSLFPSTEHCLNDENLHQYAHRFISTVLENTDERIASGKSVTPAFLFASLLWFPLQQKIEELQSTGGKPYQTFEKAANTTLNEQNITTAIPRRFVITVREIWSLQYHLQQRRGKKPLKLVYHPRFRAAYDFLLLRAETAEPNLKPIADWWTDFYEANEKDRKNKINDLLKQKKRQYKMKKKHAH